MMWWVGGRSMIDQFPHSCSPPIILPLLPSSSYSSPPPSCSPSPSSSSSPPSLSLLLSLSHSYFLPPILPPLLTYTGCNFISHRKCESKVVMACSSHLEQAILQHDKQVEDVERIAAREDRDDKGKDQVS